jgi:hypothetical protein
MYITGHDQFLMSITDFVSVSLHKGVVKQIITTDGLATYIFSKLHMFELARSLTRVVAETYASFHIDHFLSRMTNSTERKVLENKLNMTDDEEELVDLVVHGVDVEHLMHDIGIFAFHYTLDHNDSTYHGYQILHDDLIFNHSDDSIFNHSDDSIFNHSDDSIFKHAGDMDANKQLTNHASRRLLQTVREYTSLTASTSTFKSFLLTDKLTDTWLEVRTSQYYKYYNCLLIR